MARSRRCSPSWPTSPSNATPHTRNNKRRSRSIPLRRFSLRAPKRPLSSSSRICRQNGGHLGRTAQNNPARQRNCPERRILPTSGQSQRAEGAPVPRTLDPSSRTACRRRSARASTRGRRRPPSHRRRRAGPPSRAAPCARSSWRAPAGSRWRAPPRARP